MNAAAPIAVVYILIQFRVAEAESDLKNDEHSGDRMPEDIDEALVISNRLLLIGFRLRRFMQPRV
jgi:hypothetical protein